VSKNFRPKSLENTQFISSGFKIELTGEELSSSQFFLLRLLQQQLENLMMTTTAIIIKEGGW
jgi:hypothetical protein